MTRGSELLTSKSGPLSERRALGLDYSLRTRTGPDVRPERNLGSYTTTWPLPEVQAIASLFYDTNLVNRAEYPTIAEIERECLGMLGTLWHRPGGTPAGCSTTGSTEAALLAGLALLRSWQQRTTGAGRPNLVLGAGAHSCWYRFCRYWDVECRTVPGGADGVSVLPEAIADRCDADTIGAVATLGGPEVGRYDPVDRIADALDALEDRTGTSVPLHVDAASGGFVAPFRRPELRWDFELPRVTSINASGHKFGMTSLGVGWLLWRAPTDCDPALLHSAAYIGDGQPQIGLSFSRTAAPVLQQHYLLTYLGHGGYRRALDHCAGVADAVASVLARAPGLRLLNPGLDLPVVSFQDRGTDAPCVERLREAMRRRGWYLPAYRLLADPARGTASRIVIRPGFPGPAVPGLLADLSAAVGDL
ncbi:pyridoxal-dependent decarboxylase [Streptomyces sp. NPDC001941]|uniref:pyridoxal-dependent decarboxylase n=1 Tax=Streptomyces sp. NPDC001941 TaxID=3154659 RepID=UPI0033199BB9